MFTLQAAGLAHFVKGGDSSSPKLSCSVIVQYVMDFCRRRPLSLLVLAANAKSTKEARARRGEKKK